MIVQYEKLYNVVCDVEPANYFIFRTLKWRILPIQLQIDISRELYSYTDRFESLEKSPVLMEKVELFMKQLPTQTSNNL